MSAGNGNGNGDKHRAETKVGMLASMTPEQRLELSDVGFRELVAVETTETREQIQRQARATEKVVEKVAQSEAKVLGHVKVSEARVLQRMEQISVQFAAVDNRLLEERLAREHEATRRKMLENEIDVVRAQGEAGKARYAELGGEIQVLTAELKALDARTTGNHNRRELPSLNHEDLEDTAKHLIADRLHQADEDRALVMQAAKSKLEDNNAAVKAEIHVTTERRLMTPRAVALLLAPTGILAVILTAVLARGC